MSRVGVLPVAVPEGVKVELTQNSLQATGPKGVQALELLPLVKVRQEKDHIVVERIDDSQQAAAAHGLTRTLIMNAVTGVSEGFSKTLIVEGVGFKVQVNGQTVVLNLGYSHPQEVALPEGITATNEGNKLHISGADKQLVGQVAANIRSLRPPEPYKGKGIRHENERIIRKAGKAGAGK